MSISYHDAAFHAADLTRYASEAYAMSMLSNAEEWRVKMAVDALEKAAIALGYNIVKRNDIQEAA